MEKNFRSTSNNLSLSTHNDFKLVPQVCQPPCLYNIGYKRNTHLHERNSTTFGIALNETKKRSISKVENPYVRIELLQNGSVSYLKNYVKSWLVKNNVKKPKIEEPIKKYEYKPIEKTKFLQDRHRHHMILVEAREVGTIDTRVLASSSTPNVKPEVQEPFPESASSSVCSIMIKEEPIDFQEDDVPSTSNSSTDRSELQIKQEPLEVQDIKKEPLSDDECQTLKIKTPKRKRRKQNFEAEKSEAVIKQENQINPNSAKHPLKVLIPTPKGTIVQHLGSSTNGIRRQITIKRPEATQKITLINDFCMVLPQ